MVAPPFSVNVVVLRLRADHWSAPLAVCSMVEPELSTVAPRYSVEVVPTVKVAPLLRVKAESSLMAPFCDQAPLP